MIRRAGDTKIKRAGSAKKKSLAKVSPSANRQVDWRVNVLSRVRELIVEAEPSVVEDRKWKKLSNPAGVPVWSHDGMICTGETYKSYVKITFAKGASLEDAASLFNASLDGNARRAIDIREGEQFDENAFKELVRAAVSLNSKGKR